MTLFSVDGKLYKFLDSLSSLVLLNILWLVTSLPIVTIGASTTALYAVTIKMVRREYVPAVRSFFREFRSNFKQSTALWATGLTVSLVLLVDLWICVKMPSPVRKLIQFFTFGALLVAVMTMMWIFPMQAIFVNGYKRAIQNALRLTIAKLPQSVLTLIIAVCPYLLLLAQGKVLVTTSFLFIVIAVSFSAWVNAHIFSSVFKKWEG